MFLGTSGMGVSEAVAVEALGVAVSLRRFLDFEPLTQISCLLFFFISFFFSCALFYSSSRYKDYVQR